MAQPQENQSQDFSAEVDVDRKPSTLEHNSDYAADSGNQCKSGGCNDCNNKCGSGK